MRAVLATLACLAGATAVVLVVADQAAAEEYYGVAMPFSSGASNSASDLELRFLAANVGDTPQAVTFQNCNAAAPSTVTVPPDTAQAFSVVPPDAGWEATSSRSTALVWRLTTDSADFVVQQMDNPDPLTAVSETTTLIPVSRWGTDYTVAAHYQAGFSGDGQVVIVAAQDDTMVTWWPQRGDVRMGTLFPPSPNPSGGSGGAWWGMDDPPITFELDACQSLRIAAYRDATGNRITATNPIGVFVGRQDMPAGYSQSKNTEDQVMPSDGSQREFVACTSARLSDGTARSNGLDVHRIVSMEPGLTTVILDPAPIEIPGGSANGGQTTLHGGPFTLDDVTLPGKQIVTLSGAGAYYKFYSLENVHVTSDKDIHFQGTVAKHVSDSNDPENGPVRDVYGAPAQVPFLATSAWNMWADVFVPEEDWTAKILQIAVPADTVLDGALATATRTPVGSSGFQCVHAPAAGGLNRVTADGPIAVSVLTLQNVRANAAWFAALPPLPEPPIPDIGCPPRVPAIPPSPSYRPGWIPSGWDVEVCGDFCVGDNILFGDLSEIGTGIGRRSQWTWGDEDITVADWVAAPGRSLFTPPVSTTSHTYLNAGTYTIELLVENTARVQANATVTIDVHDCTWPPPSPTVGIAVVPRATNDCAPTTFTFALDALAGHLDFPVATVLVSFGDGSDTGALAWPLVAPLTHSYLSAGDYVVTAMATDVRGWEALEAATVSVNVCPNRPPVIPGTACHFVRLGSPIDIRLVATDPDLDSTLTVEQLRPGFPWENAGAGSGTGTEIRVTDLPTTNQAVEIQLRVTDDQGTTTTGRICYQALGSMPIVDTDHDGVFDGVDACPTDVGRTTDATRCAEPAVVGPVVTVGVPDTDRDGLADPVDNCYLIPNTDQLDFDRDGAGDACDPDADADGVQDITDNCQGLANPTQEDVNRDLVGDACQVLPATAVSVGPRAVVDAAAIERTRTRPDGTNELAWSAIVAGGIVALWASRRLPAALVLLFSRLRRADLAAHPTRGRLLDLVEANPGISVREAGRRSGVGRGTVTHHVDVLVAAGLLIDRHAGRRRLLFVPGQSIQVEPLAERVARLVRQQPGASISDLAEGLDTSHGAVTHHLHRFAQAGVVRLERQGRKVCAFPASP